MAEEKRKYRRVDLDVQIELEPLGINGSASDIVKAEVNDMSDAGIGFVSDVPLEVGSCYNTEIKIWTKGVIPSIVRVVRCHKIDDGKYSCGGTFVGLRDAERLKIGIYQLLNPDQE